MVNETGVSTFNHHYWIYIHLDIGVSNIVWIVFGLYDKIGQISYKFRINLDCLWIYFNSYFHPIDWFSTYFWQEKTCAAAEDLRMSPEVSHVLHFHKINEEYMLHQLIPLKNTVYAFTHIYKYKLLISFRFYPKSK